MAEEPKATVPELEKAEIPWVVAYLREDIQDLRNEVREVRRITIESYEKLDAKLDAGLARLDAKIEARTDELRQEMIRQMWRGVEAVRAAMAAIATLFAWIVTRGP